MTLVTPDTKLCDVIIDEPSAVPVINRFGITLGVGDKTVRDICSTRGINLDFFLTILNAYIFESFVPENSFDSFSATEVIGYLEQTNSYYELSQLPNIERHFKALIAKSGDNGNNLSLLLNLYMEVRDDLLRRIEDDRSRWFTEILEHEQAAGSDRLTVDLVGSNLSTSDSDAIEDKLSDLKNMFVIHLRGKYDLNLCHAVLFAVISLEKDIRQNNRIRNRVLLPLALALKKATGN